VKQSVRFCWRSISPSKGRKPEFVFSSARIAIFKRVFAQVTYFEFPLFQIEENVKEFRSSNEQKQQEETDLIETRVFIAADYSKSISV
jgi:hypothetical protein